MGRRKLNALRFRSLALPTCFILIPEGVSAIKLLSTALRAWPLAGNGHMAARLQEGALKLICTRAYTTLLKKLDLTSKS